MIARPFEWSDLEIFLAVARSGTLGTAAKALRIDTSTVQRRIGKLESAMRSELFVRSSRGYSLTESGQDVYSHVLAMDEQAIGAWRKAVGRDEQPMGTVRVATVDDVAVLVMPAIIASFREKHPNVSVTLDVRATFVNLTKREADVAIRFGMGPPQSDVVARKVLLPKVGLFASTTYLKRHGRPKTMDDLAKHLLVRADESAARLPMEGVLERYGDQNKIALRSNSFFARVAAIRAGIGIGFAPFFMVAREKTLEHLPIPIHEPLGVPHLLMLIHVDMRRNARVRAFVDHAYAALVAQREIFEGTA